MTDLTCTTCGRGVDPTTRLHLESFRDKGHRPAIARELDPQKERALRDAMDARPGR